MHGEIVKFTLYYFEDTGSNGNCPWHILCRKQCSMYALDEEKMCLQMWFGKRNVFLSMFLITDAEKRLK